MSEAVIKEDFFSAKKFTVAQLAKTAGTTKWVVLNAIHSGSLRAIKFGLRSYVIPEPWALEWINSHLTDVVKEKTINDVLPVRLLQRRGQKV